MYFRFGWLNRPRLWWLSIDWTTFPTNLRRCSGASRAKCDDLDSLSFSEGVCSGRLSVPTATTPAADENGRPAPKSLKGRSNQTPTPHGASLRHGTIQGGRHDARRHWTPRHSAALHELPTAIDGLDEKPRTVCGNGWHWGVATRLLTGHVQRPGKRQPVPNAGQDDLALVPETSRATRNANQFLGGHIVLPTTWAGRGRPLDGILAPQERAGTPTQAPLLLHLLHFVGYVGNPKADLEQGFDMIGEVRRCPGWRSREDDRYQNAISLERLRAANLYYQQARTTRGRHGSGTSGGRTTGASHRPGQSA